MIKKLEELFIPKGIRYSNFPILEDKNGETVLTNGDKCFTWRYEPIDYEQLNESTITSIANDLQHLVRSLAPNKWIKFYSWNGEYFFVTSDKEMKISSCLMTSCESVVSDFFGEEKISDINFYQNYLTVGLQYWRYVTVEVPFEDNYFDYLSNCGVDFIVSICGTSEEFSKFKLGQVRRAQSNSMSSSKHQNHDGELAYTEANNLLKDIAQDGERLLKVNLTFIVKGETISELNDKTKHFFSTFLKETKSFVETDALPYLFQYSILGVIPSFAKSFIATSRYSSNLIPFKRSFLNGVGLELYDRDMKDLISFDLLNPELINNHCLVTGASGAGKSFFVGSLIWDLIARNHSVAVFDFGNSFGRLVKFLGGENLQKRINPMQFKDDPSFLKNFIMAFLDSKNMNRLENGKLFSAVQEALEEEPLKFSELIFLMEKNYPDLSMYFCEMWDYFTDEILEIPEFFFVDTKGISEYLIAPYLVFAKKLIESSGRNFVSVFDECYVFFDKCPDIIRTSVKSERKEGNKNIFITQEIVELQRDYSRVADAIMGNTETKIFFQQKDTSHPMLSDFQRQNIDILRSKKDEYSEMFISNSLNNKIARLVSNPLMYELCHTEQKRRILQEEYINELEPIIGYQKAMIKWSERNNG